MTTSQAFLAHVTVLYERAQRGDMLAVQTLCCLALLTSGWRYGDADPQGDAQAA